MNWSSISSPFEMCCRWKKYQNAAIVYYACAYLRARFHCVLAAFALADRHHGRVSGQAPKLLTGAQARTRLERKTAGEIRSGLPGPGFRWRSILVVVSCPSVLQHVAYGSVKPRLLLFDVRRSVNRSDIEKQLQGFAVERLVRFVSTGGSRPHVTPPSPSRAPSTSTWRCFTHSQQRQRYNSI